MKYLVASSCALLCMVFSSIGMAAEIPYDQTEFDAVRTAGRPVAVVFHADWCPTCRAQAPVLKSLLSAPEFKELTVFVANFDTAKRLERSLAVTKQSTIVVFKGGREAARSTGDTQPAPLAALLHHAID
jgi:thiol-disulfide isomerase/thioredoxin